MIVLFFGIFAVAGIVHIFLGHFADGGLLLGVAAFLGFVIYFMGREAKERRAFLEWLKSKQPEIEKGWSYYKVKRSRRRQKSRNIRPACHSSSSPAASAPAFCS